MLEEIERRYRRMLEEKESRALTLARQGDLSFVLRCGVCNEKYPRPVQVGKAMVDGSGQWFVGRVERYGKGYPKASAESRWAPRGLILQVYWPDGSAIDAQLEGFNWEMHLKHLVDGDDAARAIVGERRLGVFRCRDGHWVGADSMEELLNWIEVAHEEGLEEIPLPKLKPVMTD